MNKTGSIQAAGRSWTAALGIGVLAAIGSLIAASPAVASLPPAPSREGVGCMEEQAGTDLNCSANDVRVSKVALNERGEPALEIFDDGCAYPGDTVDFKATFEVITTATSRYDIGIYFSTDLDTANDGALTGSCAVSVLDSTLVPDSGRVPSIVPAPDLDADHCGDSTKASSPLYTTVALTGVMCADKDDDGFLDLPNCVSWRQTGANQFCDAATDAFPGAPSKCNCNESFNIPIAVPDAELLVTKEANPTKVNEPGDNVTYTVTVRNTGIDPNNGVTLKTMVDDFFGDLTYVHGDIVSTTCNQGANKFGWLEPLVDTYTCQFVARTNGNAGDEVNGLVKASGTDDRGAPLSGTDDAPVTVVDVPPTIEVDKTPSTDQVLDPGGNVTFVVTVRNTSAKSDPITIKSILDNYFGDVTAINGSTCKLDVVVAAAAPYQCEFTAYVTGPVGTAHVNEVSVLAIDDEDNVASNKDTALVNIVDVKSSIDVTKTARAATLPVHEPGGTVTYDVVVTNKSAKDRVFITSLYDDKFGEMIGRGTCTPSDNTIELAPGQGYACAFDGEVRGNAGYVHTNTLTASGTDDDGGTVSFSDDETVVVRNVPPAVSLKKNVYKVRAYYAVEVTNESESESVFLVGLTDDKFGDLDGKGDCVADGTVEITPKGKYSCTFDGEVYEDHINEVTATIRDDEGDDEFATDTAEVNLK